MKVAVSIVSLFGIALAGYAVYVEHEKSQNPDFVALCDLGASMSCSKVFNSKYGRMLSLFGIVEDGSPLDLPNAAIGLVYYTLTLLYPAVRLLPLGKPVMLLASTFSCVTSVYLGYILMFVLQDLCVVCTSTYVINTIIFILILLDVRRGGARKAKRA